MTARAVALSAQAGFPAQSCSSAISVSNGETVNPEPFRKSAEILPLGIVPLPRLREDIRKWVADLFWRTFDGDSLNDKCDDAEKKIAGVSADTFARIAAKDTGKIDHALVQVMQALHEQKHGFAFPELAIRARRTR